jgi:HPt (histidine-containing phosphotransfer) domain-containing protein
LKETRKGNEERPKMPNASQPPNEPSIDFPELLARVDNDRDLLLDLMSIFKEEFPRHLRELTDVIAVRDLKKMSVVSHTLKGMLANLAVTRAASAAGKLEQLARDGAAEPEIGDALRAFQREVQGVLPEMDAYMAEVQR